MVQIGTNGKDGQPNTLKIGTVSSGTTASATITGTAPNQTLNLTLPKGDKGDAGTNATTTATATSSANGLMSKEDKAKLDGIATGATKNVVENVLTSTSTTNALSAAQGKALNDGKVPTGRTIAGVNLVDNITASELATALKTAMGNLMYPVGSIYISVNSTNPSSLFGGTWSAWGTGKVPVGIDTNDNDFKTVEKTGGEKTHKLTINELAKHLHRANIVRSSNEGAGYGLYGGGAFTGRPIIDSGKYDGWADAAFESIGGDQAHNNLQPYITCYMWKRTA